MILIQFSLLTAAEVMKFLIRHTMPILSIVIYDHKCINKATAALCHIKKTSHAICKENSESSDFCLFCLNYSFEFSNIEGWIFMRVQMEFRNFNTGGKFETPNEALNKSAWKN